MSKCANKVQLPFRRTRVKISHIILFELLHGMNNQYGYYPFLFNKNCNFHKVLKLMSLFNKLIYTVKYCNVHHTQLLSIMCYCIKFVASRALCINPIISKPWIFMLFMGTSLSTSSIIISLKDTNDMSSQLQTSKQVKLKKTSLYGSKLTDKLT